MGYMQDSCIRVLHNASVFVPPIVPTLSVPGSLCVYVLWAAL
nr:MAG TPA: hypothetical protein [Bacteriophage sp.]